MKLDDTNNVLDENIRKKSHYISVSSSVERRREDG